MGVLEGLKERVGLDQICGLERPLTAVCVCVCVRHCNEGGRGLDLSRMTHWIHRQWRGGEGLWMWRGLHVDGDP
jgi:hypothetical protein